MARRETQYLLDTPPDEIERDSILPRVIPLEEEDKVGDHDEDNGMKSFSSKSS